MRFPAASNWYGTSRSNAKARTSPVASPSGWGGITCKKGHGVQPSGCRDSSKTRWGNPTAWRLNSMPFSGGKNESRRPRCTDRSGFDSRYRPVSFVPRRAGAGRREGEAGLRDDREDSGRGIEPFASDGSYQLAVGRVRPAIDRLSDDQAGERLGAKKVQRVGPRQ